MARRSKEMAKSVRAALEDLGLEVLGFERTAGHQFVRFTYRDRERKMSFPYSPGRGKLCQSRARIRNHLRRIDDEGRT